MIDCMKCLEGLSDYIYKQLPPQQASHIEAHLRICSPCQKEYEILSSTLTMLDKWEDIKAEPSSLVAIKARLQAEHQKRNHHLPSYIQVGAGLYWDHCLEHSLWCSGTDYSPTHGTPSRWMAAYTGSLYPPAPCRTSIKHWGDSDPF